MRPASWSYQLLDAGPAHQKGADSLLRGQRNIFGERPLHALLATMEYRMLAMPGGTPSPVADPSRQRPTSVDSRSQFVSAPRNSQAAGSERALRAAVFSGPEA